ncbi:hypothetical protein PTSG_11070 [Salpingoeca rosetta]|uniref:Spatacsin C-terminal domain-containing protein n=1 Tax=Salpingoeca rosetta (strain ATCC 50818 / BSB-021) TaxID=946362 RepID=F2US20_SALR5|nr:uncharacterized protein PTSG_11070 [Salpingoeca rosetta]EGD80425.1 hypothetical protein PTSG_11070 [Salpingoeca rosetta]|eukprot:XP_004987989.1 hypothetical protein PTSG_11070 [Salpingoeca rosetta]
MAIARDIEAMYPCASTEVAGVQRRKQQELPQLLFVLHFASMLAASTAQRERTPATGDKATGAKDKLDANSNDNSSNAAANAASARFEFRLRTLTDTEPDAEWWSAGDDDLPPSAAASVQSPLYSQVRLDFLDRMSDDGVDRLRAEALLTSHQVLALGEVDTDTMLSYWRVVRDACRHERFAFFTAPLRAACEAHEVTEDDITSLLDGMDTYSRLQAEKGFHGAGLFGLAYTLASDRDVRTLTRQIWRSGNVLADTRLSTVLPATALDAVKRHIAAVVTDNNFQLLALLLSRTNGWRWERNSPLEGVNFIDLNSAEDMTRYLQVQLSAKAAAAASNSGTPAAPTTPANETISTHAPAPVFDEDVDEPETTPELCHRLMRNNCLPSLLMLSAFDPGALQAAEGAEDVQLLLRAMNPTTPTPADGDLLLKLLQNATGTHARAVFAWLARTPAHTTDRVVSQDDVNSNNSNSSISGGARHWFVRRALPAFDSPELRSHALEDSLDFVFYIEQGRPLFAMQLFDREERGHLTPDATTRIYAAVMTRPMHLPCVAAALSFLSRLEREDVATYLRQDVQAAQRLIQTRTSHKTSSIGSSNVLSQDQSSLMTMHRHRAGQYLAALSRATQIILESKRGGHRVYEPDLSSSPSSLSSPSSSSIQTPADVIETWDLVLMIARRHGVVFVPDFLGYVDADNQWLFLTAYAQFYSVQPQHVIDVVQQQMNAGTTKEHVRAMLYKVVHTQPDTPTTAAAQTMVAHPHYTIPDGASDDAGNGLHLVDFLQLARDATQSCSASIPEVLLALAFRQRCPTMALLATCYGSNLTYTCLLVWLLTKLHSIGHVPLSAQLASIEADIVCEANGVCHLHIDSERGFSLCKEAIVLYIRLGFLNPLQACALCLCVDALGLFAEQAFKPVVKAIDLAHKHAERSATAVLHEEVKAGTTKGTWDALFLAFFKHTPTSLRAREILAAALRASNFPIADQHLHKRVHPNQQDGADTDKPSSPRTADAAVREAIAAGDFVDARARAIRAGLGTAAVDVAQAYEIAKKEVDIKTGSVHEENKRDDSLSRAIVTECLHHFERHSVDARTKALFFVSLVSAAFGVAEPHLPYATRVSGITKAADEALLLDTGLTLLPRSHHKMRSALRSIEVMLWQRRLEVQTYVINNTSGEPPIVPIDENETIGKRGWRGEEAQADKNPAHFKCPSRLLARSSNGYDEDDDEDEAVARVPESQERAFHLFLQVLLRRGSVGRAAHLCMLFNFYHPAIVAAQLSVYLAWETWTPDEAHPLAEEHLGLSFKEGDVEHCLQALVSAATLASACVARILANYRMAKKLCMPLQSFFSQEALKLEVLRRAYTCFAGFCYMDVLQEFRSLLNDQVHTFPAEGNVLGLCQFLVSVRNIREFEFIIAHLYRTQHFEQLLRRGMSHLDEQTKLDFQSFLRDFLDRQPRSHYKAELQEILPIFFDVSADLGAMLMDKADRILSDFVPDKMDSPDFVDALIMCTETLADAASHFLKAGAPSDARTCAWRAQLCALQTQHDDQLLLLSTDEAKERMRTISSFGACRILGEHYMPAAGDEKYCEPVFHNVIVVPGMLASATSSSSLSPFATTTAAATSLPDLDPPRYWDEFKRHTTLTPLFFRDMQRRLKRFLHDAQPENEAPFKAAFAAILMDCPFLVELELMVKMMPDICTKRLRAKCSALAVVQSASKTVFDVTPAAFADHTATW